MNPCSTNVAAELCGASYRQLLYWTHRGLVAPNGAKRGSGSRLAWPAVEVAIARMILAVQELALGSRGIDLDTLKPAATLLRSTIPARWPDTLTVSRDGRLGDDGGEAAILLRPSVLSEPYRSLVAS